MAKSLFGALFGALIGMLAGAWFVQVQMQGPHSSAQRDLWPRVVEAQLALAKPLDKDGLPTVVALAEELHALRRQRWSYGMFNARHWFRTLAPSADEDTEERALDFMIQKVTATLDGELDGWQSKMNRVNELDPIAKNATLRLLGFVKWQQKGGEYEYAYEFFDELSRSAPPAATPAKENGAVTAPEDGNPWPLQPPKRRKGAR